MNDSVVVIDSQPLNNELLGVFQRLKELPAHSISLDLACVAETNGNVMTLRLARYGDKEHKDLQYFRLKI